MALKKCYDAFRSSEDGQATYREVMYLTEMAGHDNIVRLLQVIKGENNRDVYLVFEYMETDLYSLIRADEAHGILQDVHKKYMVYQLLKAVKYMHSADLVHRDIKPGRTRMPHCASHTGWSRQHSVQQFWRREAGRFWPRHRDPEVVRT